SEMLPPALSHRRWIAGRQVVLAGATAMMAPQNDECGEDYVSEIGWIGRRDLVRLLGIGGAALAAGMPKRVHAAAAGGTLVLGIDISDSITFDPAREAQY